MRGPTQGAPDQTARVVNWMLLFARFVESRGALVTVETSRPTRGRFRSQSWNRTAEALIRAEFDSVSLAVAGSVGGSNLASATYAGVTDAPVASLLVTARFFDQRILSDSEFVERCIVCADPFGLP
jgi:hypothetical protein